MKKCITIASAAALTAFTASAASAATIYIDQFDDVTPQTVSDDELVPGIPPQGLEVAESVLGGYRDLYVETLPAHIQLGTTLSVQAGNLSFNNSSGQYGYGQVVYDGMDGDPTSSGNVNTTGLGGIDLTFGFTNASFFFDVVRTDGDFVFTATMWDMGGNSHTYSENILGSFSPFLSFAEFTSNGVDTTNVGALAFEVVSFTTGDAIDGALNSISVVPLPASALLLLGGLGGLGGMSAAKRRRRRKAS